MPNFLKKNSAVIVKSVLLFLSGFLLMGYNELINFNRQSLLIAQLEFVIPVIALICSLVYLLVSLPRSGDLKYFFVFALATILLLQLLLVTSL